jgi:phosphoglycerate kinase
MEYKSVKQIRTLERKRVLLRLDLNVPLEGGQVAKHGTWRLERVLATLQYLIESKSKIIIVTHLGRPDGKRVEELSLKPVAEDLGKMLGQSIDFWDKDLRTYEDDSMHIKDGQVVMLENIRFEAGETNNDKDLAFCLSKLADIYVNDAFANMHRTHASMVAICEHLPAYTGLLVAQEIEELSQVLNTKKGLVAILGGAKIATKIKLIKIFVQKADSVLLGGALANTMLAAKGLKLGKSVVDKKELVLAKKLLNKKIILPQDAIVASSLNARTSYLVDIDQLRANDMVLDIGKKTIKDFAENIKNAKLIIWNGPLGYTENDLFEDGSKKLLQAIIASTAKIIIGGGETVELVQKFNMQEDIDFMSTGGGAMLTYLQGDKLVALEKLKTE